MTYEIFLKLLAEDIPHAMREKHPGLTVEISEVEKLQGKSYKGLRIKGEGLSLGISADMQNFYSRMQEERLPYMEVLDMVVASLEQNMEKMPPVSSDDLIDYELVKRKLMIQVISTEANADMLKTVPHLEIADMSEVYRILLDDSKDRTATILVTNEMLKFYRVTPEQLRVDAIAAGPENNPYNIRDMLEFLMEMSGGLFPLPERPKESPRMLVASNGSRMLGAGAIAYRVLWRMRARRSVCKHESVTTEGSKNYSWPCFQKK